MQTILATTERSINWWKLTTVETITSLHYKYRVAAIIVNNGVGAAANNDPHIGKHAELEALRKSIDSVGATIYIARTNVATPAIGRLSRPCRMCFIRIRTAGIKYMIFLDEENSIVRKVVMLEDIKDYIPRQDLE